jgi:iron(III) transport system permease protein
VGAWAIGSGASSIAQLSAADLPLSDNEARRTGSGGGRGLTIAAVTIAALLALPVLGVVAQVFRADEGTIAHLAATVLPDYALNTLVLCVLVAAGTAVLGTAAAWLVTMTEFPGRGVLAYALVLPLAVPAYVIAYAATDALAAAGPLQSALRAATGWETGSYWFPQIRNIWGAGLLFTLVLYPYVYLIARAAFLSQSVCALDVARTLGSGPWGAFFRVGLPLAWPAIAGGVALALMETLADYGAVQHLAVQTFATGIFRAWYAFGDRTAAAQLAVALLGFVILALALERFARGRQAYHHTSGRQQAIVRVRLSPGRAVLACLACTLPPLLGFVLPGAWLVILFTESSGAGLTPRLLNAGAVSLALGLGAALLTVGAALVIAYARRVAPSRWTNGSGAVAGLGYALPGPVIAAGILIPMTALDQAINAFAVAYFGVRTGLLITGTVAGLLFAYTVRFTAPALSAIEAGVAKVTPSIAGAARILSRGPRDALLRVHAPLIAPSVLTAALVVFVDVMKELPATLLMRPFNTDTLAVLAYSYASDERLDAAGGPALAIVLAGLVPLILIMRRIARDRPGADQAGSTKVHQ